MGFSRLVPPLVFGCFVLIASCGGESVRNQADAGEAGESSGGAQAAGAGRGGSTTGSGGASAGTSPSGTGGTPGNAGTTSVAGATVAGTTAAGGCGNLEPPCDPLVCLGGGKLIDVPCGCPYCSCEGVTCATTDCAPGFMPARPAGACCDECVPTDDSCSAVTCEPPTECPEGRSWQRPKGACCAGCIPDEPLRCPELACPPSLECPLGYTAGDGTNGCCFECVPDPLYCERPDDCVVATKPSGCCYCAQVISRRLDQEDQCWISAGDIAPSECLGDVFCDVACAPCPDPGIPMCSDGHCLGVSFVIE